MVKITSMFFFDCMDSLPAKSLFCIIEKLATKAFVDATSNFFWHHLLLAKTLFSTLVSK